MSNLESLISDIGEGEFGLLTEDRIREYYNTDFMSEPTKSRPLTIEEAKDFSRDVSSDRGFGVAPSQFSSDEEFFELLEDVSEWGMDAYNIQVLFGGELDEHGYIDTVYLVYDNVVGRGMRGQAGRMFEQSVLRKFAQSLSVYSENNNGLCPFCNANIEVESVRDEEVLRDKENLVARPTELDFREYPGYGQTARLWFDD